MEPAPPGSPPPPGPGDWILDPQQGLWEAQRRVSGPGIGLIATGVLGACLQGLVILSNLAQLSGLMPQQPPPPGMSPQLEQALQLATGVLGLGFALLALLLAGLLVKAGIDLRGLRNRTLVQVAAVLAIVPCFSPCCCLGLPVGVWTLIVLSDPHVSYYLQR